MGKEANRCGVSSDLVRMLDHSRGLCADCIPQLATPVKAMNFAAQLVARFNIALFSRPDIITSKLSAQSGTLQERQRFAR